jgi:hypothetical protein
MESRVSVSDEEMFFHLATQNNFGAHTRSYETVKQGPLLGLKGHFHFMLIFNPLLFTSNRFRS